MKKLAFIALSLLCLTACDREYSNGVLAVRNETDSDLYLEFKIVSIRYDDVVCRMIGNPSSYLGNKETLTSSRACKCSRDEFDISNMVWNEDAYLKVFRITDNDTIFLKEWKYSEKDNPGRQLFDLSDCELNGSHAVEGGNYLWCYEFVIKQEDIEPSKSSIDALY